MATNNAAWRTDKVLHRHSRASKFASGLTVRRRNSSIAVFPCGEKLKRCRNDLGEELFILFDYGTVGGLINRDTKNLDTFVQTIGNRKVRNKKVCEQLKV